MSFRILIKAGFAHRLLSRSIQRRARLLPIVLVSCFSLFLLSGCKPFFFFGTFQESYASHLKRAEEYTRQEKFTNAIAEYEQHIESRLALEKRPEWENPYFYYILIADLYLKLDKVPEALAALETAEKEGVEKGLLSDRIRYVANWLTEQGRHKEALEVLEKYRDRDPLMFDLSLDRIARELTKEEEKALDSQSDSDSSGNLPSQKVD